MSLRKFPVKKTCFSKHLEGLPRRVILGEGYPRKSKRYMGTGSSVMSGLTRAGDDMGQEGTFLFKSQVMRINSY